MRVVRGRPSGIEEDRAVTRALAGDVAETGEPAVRAWTPARQVAFGRRDARAGGYDRAREAAREHGFPPYERSVGGRAVAYSGTTVAFVRAEPVGDARGGIDRRYRAAVADVERALDGLGVDTERTEPPDAWCPGAHSLSAADGGGKLVGIAQRVTDGAAVVAGCALVADRAALAAVLTDVYGALGLPFDPASVGSLARASDRREPPDAGTVARAIEDALVGDREARVERVS
ncbi:MAG: lipoate--protein ligase family protein [Haloarculaceae archaeon]